MKIAIAADHAGFSLKETLRDRLQTAGHDLIDFGAFSSESTDYPDYAVAVAEAVASGKAARGILVCFTGAGMSIAANKVAGVRAAVGTRAEAVQLVREHNDANVIALGAKFLSADEAAQLVDVFLTTNFDGGARHTRRIQKIAAIERTQNQEQVLKA
ncbi:MAG TPA: ribose 5-phosphate isomerase B [Bryobacteraceae bacterium]|nr:ribose 5-phosphate isomerase B [Bryobacteraceae bacterium]